MEMMMCDLGSVYSYNCLTNVIKLGEDEFVIGKISGNKFIESKISGNKKEILEIADFINRANNILENSGGVGPVFKIDEKGALIVESKQISNYGRDGEEYYQHEYFGDLCQKIIDSVMGKALLEHSVIKKNITAILEFLNT